MEPIPAFLWSLGGATALGAIVSLALVRPLSPLLSELCGSPARARFWAVFTVCATQLTVLFTALLSAPSFRRRSDVALEVFDVFVNTARSGVFGLLVALGSLGFVLLLAIGQFEARRNASQLARAS